MATNPCIIMFDEKTAEVNTELKCKNCAAPLRFAPGTKSLTCEHCGAVNNIVDENTEFEPIEEFDFESFNTIDDSQKYTIQVLKCNACGASTSYNPTIASANCAFCASPLVVSAGGHAESVLKPKSLIPFVIDKNKAIESFKKYAGGQFFAPNDFQKITKNNNVMQGMYMPYWSYDADVHTQYIGQRGIDYQTTETYTTTENGRSVVKTRQVTRTHWYYVSGVVDNNFDDVMVIASHSLPAEQANALDPWDGSGLVPYNDSFLAGFKAEMYNINLKDGFEAAKGKMQPIINDTICRDIGGDHQRITRSLSEYSNVKFKHSLLPVWITSIKYKDKVYYFLVNGQSGKVQGQQPYSAIKIALAVLLVLVIIYGIYVLTQQQ